jgi:hypothetical protein
VNNLIGYLDPAIMAGILNNNGAWVGDLISNLNTSMVVDVVDNLDPAWTSQLFTSLNNATTLGVIGNIANSPQFTAFVDALIGYLDPAIMAGILNNNGAWVGDLISNLNTSMVVDVVDNLDPAWTSQLFTSLNNATTLGPTCHRQHRQLAPVHRLRGRPDRLPRSGHHGRHPQQQRRLGRRPHLQPEHLHGGGRSRQPGSAWTSQLFTSLNNATTLGVIGNIANSPQFTAFVDALIGYLDPAIMAGILNNNGAWVGDLISNLNTSMVVDVVDNLDPAWTSQLFTSLNNATTLGVIGNIANDPATTSFITALLPELDAAALAGVVNANSALGAGNTLIENLVGNLDSNTAAATARGVNSNLPFVEDLLANLDPSIVAQAINANGAFVSGLMQNLNPTVLANAINANGAFVTSLVGALDANVIAAVVNSNGTFLNALIGALNPSVIADAINANQAFVTNLVGALNPQVLANAINANGTFIQNLIGFLDASVLALAVNNNQAFVTDMVTNLSPSVLANAINANEVFLSTLLTGLDPQVLANVLNSNAVRNWLTDVVSRLNTAQVAYIINNNQTFLTNLIGSLNPVVLAAAINANGAFLNNLIGNLSPVVLAGAINTNGPFLTSLIQNLNPAVLAGALNANGAFISGLLGALDPNVVAGALTSASGLGFVTNLIMSLGGPSYNARGQALVNALNATGVDYGNNDAPITFFDQFIVMCHTSLSVLGLGRHIEVKVEGFKWDPDGGMGSGW